MPDDSTPGSGVLAMVASMAESYAPAIDAAAGWRARCLAAGFPEELAQQAAGEFLSHAMAAIWLAVERTIAATISADTGPPARP